MDIQDLVWLSIKDLREKKVRTALTILMVVIGVAAIVSLTSLTAGVGASIQSSLSSLGPTSIIIAVSGTTAFTQQDIDNLLTLPNVSSVTPILTGQAYLLINGNTTPVTVIGVTTQGLQALLGNSTGLYQGSLYQDTVAPLAVLGNGVIFPTATSGQQAVVGQIVTLEVGSGRSVTKTEVPIAGILQSVTSIIPINTGVIFSMPAAQVLLHKTSFNEILVKASNATDVTGLAAQITTIYGSRARVEDTQQLAATAASIIGTISLLFTLIAGISLLVAAVGIMNVMLISVLEKVHEIGVLKSVGFKNRNVMLIFLMQALAVGLIGGVLGIAGGVGGSYALTSLFTHQSTSSAPSAPTAPSGGFGGGGGAAPGGGAGFAAGGPSTSSSISFHPVFTASIIFEAIAIAVVISMLAGVYPAWRASKMEPIDALRQL